MLRVSWRAGCLENMHVRFGVGGKVELLALHHNKTAELASWNMDLLPIELAELQGAGIDWSLLGFDEDELAKMLGGDVKAGLTDPDEVPEPPDEAITKRGDLWVLGDHRLLCGDSASTEDLDRLLGGKPVHLANLDPPYNVRLEPRSKNAVNAGLATFAAYLSDEAKAREAKKRGTLGNHQGFDLARGVSKGPGTGKMRPKDRPLQNDFISDEAFEELLSAWFGNLARVLLPGRSFYIWGGWSNLGNYPPVLKRCGLFWHQQLIWVKNSPVLCRKDFMLAHEWCFYGWREGAGHEFFGPNNIRDIWEVKKVPQQQMVHLTEKPVELAVRAIQYSSRPGENVLDLFGGSGSTLIAAEQTGRRAYLMELDPLYCVRLMYRVAA
jgi:DNA modification methylase